jgi:hypothetical protein
MVRDTIDRHYKIVKNPLVLLVFFAVMHNANRVFGTNYYAIFNVMVYYSMVIYIVSQYGDDYRYMLLGVATSFFLSEYWEIPIYLWQLLVKGFYAEFNIIQNIYLLERFVLKILTFYYVIWGIRSVGGNHKTFTKNLIKFSIIYIPSVFIIFTIINDNHLYGMDLNWFFRLICFGFILQYLYKEVINNKYE